MAVVDPGTMLSEAGLNAAEVRQRVAAGHVNVVPQGPSRTTADIVRKVQQALASTGHYKGPIDGAIGSATRTALSSYQDAQGLARGQLTMETLKSLGVSI